jgi:hypothetical protein
VPFLKFDDCWVKRLYTVLKKTLRDAGAKKRGTENSANNIDWAARSMLMTDFSDRSMWMTEFSATFVLYYAPAPNVFFFFNSLQVCFSLDSRLSLKSVISIHTGQILLKRKFSGTGEKSSTSHDTGFYRWKKDSKVQIF